MGRYILLTAACALGAAAFAPGAEPLPEPVAAGSRLSHSLCETFVNGPYAGTERSLICDLAGRSAVLVYAREMDPILITLLKKLDAVALGDKERKMRSCFVLLTTKDEDEKALQAVADKEGFKATALAFTPLQWEKPFFGNTPGRRNLQREAAVTVILLQRHTVKSSHSFRRGELTDEKVEELVKAAADLLPPQR